MPHGDGLCHVYPTNLVKTADVVDDVHEDARLDGRQLVLADFGIPESPRLRQELVTEALRVPELGPVGEPGIVELDGVARHEDGRPLVFGGTAGLTQDNARVAFTNKEEQS